MSELVTLFLDAKIVPKRFQIEIFYRGKNNKQVYEIKTDMTDGQGQFCAFLENLVKNVIFI